MEPKRRGRPPKVKVENTPKAVNNSRDAIITIHLSVPGEPEIKDTVKIKDVIGNMTPSQRKPKVLMKAIKDKLQ